MTENNKTVKSTGAVVAEIELEIKSSRSSVWKALTENINQWWPKDFYASQRPAQFKVDLKLGGNMYEDCGDGGGLIWFTILGFWPEEMLYVIGHTRPPYGGPASGLITFEMKDTDNGNTLFKVSDATFGHVSENTVASAQEGWKAIFTPMKEFLEKSS